MKIAPCGSWKSPVTSDLIVEQSIGLSEVRFDGDEMYWLESRPQEGGRSVVVRYVSWNASTEDITPQGFNVRTRVHEYGGGAWSVFDGMVYFSNYADNRLYRMDRYGNQPLPLTPEGPWRYADGFVDPRRRGWIGVREDHGIEDRQPVNTLVRVDIGGDPDSGTILASGHDFYSSPRLSPDGRWLAFLAWDHPNMPWMGTGLYVVQLDPTGASTGEPIQIAGGESESVFQPEWAPDGSALYFVSDRSGWWNIYRQKSRTPTEPLAPMDAEFGQPQWVLGMSSYAFAGPGKLVCSYHSKGLGYLAVLDLASGDFKTLDVPFTDFSYLRGGREKIAFRAGSGISPAGIVLFNVESGQTDVLKKSNTVADDPDLAKYFSKAEPVEFPTGRERTAFGLYYPAWNPDYEPAEGDRPPLLVKCHGGPTSAATGILNLQIQYWTSRGVAVLDVNYGGSSGFGREYRRRLDGNWGIVDIEDCINGAKFLAGQGMVDGERSVITGGSAGGYTVLAALTFHDYFRGGASHYGVSDLAILARDTHKFESRYLDTLVGPYPEKADVYRERSPISCVDRLSAPVIFFQGDEDEVVPPNQAEMMVDALRKKGTPVGYLLFSGEQHGFRKAANIKRALDAELYFYATNVFRTGLTF
ncbi:MAG: prolyl oligopeptidase family serine peptidase [Acidobacteriota bacterium]|nr:prolyl oligopeptidase family serine peptidase [Acidobacteriota bacterium]